MQQHRVAFGRSAKARAVEPEIGRALRRIAEREAAQDAIALDRMQRAADAVANVVERRRERLADARGVVAVAPAMGEARDDRGAQQTLTVDDLIVTRRPDGAQAAADFAERCRREKRLPPAPPAHRNDLADRRMRGDERGKGLLHQPGEAGVGPRLARLG